MCVIEGLSLCKSVLNIGKRYPQLRKMNKNEYAKYLVEFANEEINLSDLRCAFYGYFQQFIHRKEELKKVFKPIENGDLYYERLIRVYNSINDNFNEIKNSEQTNKDYLVQLGERHISNIKRISKIINDKELTELITGIKDVKIQSENYTTSDEDDSEIIIYETISDWFINNTDYSNNIEILSEAYYSINCDYTLSRYLQYPKYKDMINFDIYEPYFEFWKLGYTCYFEKDKLIVKK